MRRAAEAVLAAAERWRQGTATPADCYGMVAARRSLRANNVLLNDELKYCVYYVTRDNSTYSWFENKPQPRKVSLRTACTHEGRVN